MHRQPKPILGLLAALWLCAVEAGAQTRSFVCPVDGTRINQQGGDGHASPSMYSDLEFPSDAYANRIVACPSCGYAHWALDFERLVDGAVSAFVHQTLKKDARRVVEPRIAWQHFVELLRFRNVAPREQISGLLYYTYVLKRSRPGGGQDYDLEMLIKAVRLQILDLLFKSLRDDPPKSERARLEWLYLTGELMRLTGEHRRAEPLLADVCGLRELAGRTIGDLACEMAERAKRGQCFEDYRGGVVDVTTAKPPQKSADLPAAVTKTSAPPPPLVPLPPMERAAPPRASVDTAPPPPPIPR